MYSSTKKKKKTHTLKTIPTYIWAVLLVDPLQGSPWAMVMKTYGFRNQIYAFTGLLVRMFEETKSMVEREKTQIFLLPLLFSF